MSALYPSKSDTLTSRNIVDAYRSAYASVHGDPPEQCEHLKGRWFIINGEERDRSWVILEVERLRQEAIIKATDNDSSSRGRIFKMLRKLSRI
jgi:hypothetical protein